MRWLANFCYFIAAVLYAPVLIYQMVCQDKNRRGWRERFGHIAPREGGRPCLWIHAVSVGEVNATRALVQQIRNAFLDVEIVVSTTTDTGYDRAKTLYPDLKIFRYPLDFSWVIRRVLDRLRPTVIVLMELEVWYNLSTIAAGRGIKVCVVNGRFTARSAMRLRLIRPLVRRMFSALAWVGAQDEHIAERFRRAGVAAECVEVVGSLKWDTATIAEHIDGEKELAAALGIRGNRPLVVLGSSGPGEEEMVIDACERLPVELNDIQLAIVPRKPERFSEVAKLIEKKGRTCFRRSEQPDGSLPPTNTSGRGIVLGDTMGELRKFYSLSDVVMVGRTLVPLGGSDPMEVAALGKSIIVGPHTENFADPVARLEQADAIVHVDSPTELSHRLEKLLTDADLRRGMGERARSVVRQNQGATARTVQQLQRLLRDESQTPLD
jgi:3-deoxy-D-manno-octulosonic-acid transferase